MKQSYGTGAGSANTDGGRDRELLELRRRVERLEAILGTWNGPGRSPNLNKPSDGSGGIVMPDGEPAFPRQVPSHVPWIFTLVAGAAFGSVFASVFLLLRNETTVDYYSPLTFLIVFPGCAVAAAVVGYLQKVHQPLHYLPAAAFTGVCVMLAVVVGAYVVGAPPSWRPTSYLGMALIAAAYTLLSGSGYIFGGIAGAQIRDVRENSWAYAHLVRRSFEHPVAGPLLLIVATQFVTQLFKLMFAQ